MEFKVLSDLHIDKYSSLPFADWVSKGDKARALIVAGDVCSLTTPSPMKRVLNFLSEQFAYVFIALGNHEYAHGDLTTTVLQMSALIKSLGKTNVFLLQKNDFISDDFIIIGATLWSDLSHNKSMLMAKSHRKQAAFFEKNAAHLTAKERYDIMQTLHCDEKKWLFEQMKKHQLSAKKIIVVTHYAPSFNSINPIFKTDNHRFFYASNLDKDIDVYSPHIWLHGHTHYHCDYYIGSTRILANPYGLPGEKTHFDSTCTFLI